MRVCLLIETYISSKTGTCAPRAATSRSAPRAAVLSNPSENEALKSTSSDVAASCVLSAPNSSTSPPNSRQLLLESIIANRWLYRFEEEALETERIRLYKILRRYRYLLDARRSGRAWASAPNPATAIAQTQSIQSARNAAGSSDSIGALRETESESMQPVSAREEASLPPIPFSASTTATPRRQNSYQQV